MNEMYPLKLNHGKLQVLKEFMRVLEVWNTSLVKNICSTKNIMFQALQLDVFEVFSAGAW